MIRHALLALLVGCTTNDDIHAPSVASVNPARATPGASVVVSGSYFCAQVTPSSTDDVDPLACEHIGVVEFGTTPASAIQYTDTTISVEVPGLSSGVVQVRVSVAGRTSNGVSFTVE